MKSRGKRYLMLLILFYTGMLTAQIPFTTQPEKTQTRNGNKNFKKDNYTDAEADYKKALNEKNNMPEAVFNLGDAVYEQKRYEEAAKQFQLSAQTNADPVVKAKAYHNLGNTLLEQKKWADAISAYKNALKINPKDADTKYNLAYANAMMQQQQGGGENKQDQKNKKEDKKDQQQNKQDNKDQKQDEQQGKQQEQKEQQQKQGQQQQAKLSKEDAEKLLQALMNEEQKTNQKMQQKQMKPVNVKIQKDW
ncbi:MAG: tetratricopeptide repeat protein [Bacteroidetes bacterium]|nr:tetratricopeptide repeat protein [Bacteroidota bacterium]